ncbi:hypothetical protein [Pinibacter aurantiacus]|uniref:Big-1 domain-containing protein n=1 Tax=Pinibacter aurantiacus TaxID=2851599 RepID=A0A9E2W7T8_9BACT|nr:hypothetical protein [Pinibacter aurantiacus]MBV4357241.1 hypothetical protein [Pinibacter aurantiacus]
MKLKLNHIIRGLALSCSFFVLCTQRLSAQDSTNAEAQITLTFGEQDSVKQAKAVVTKNHAPLKGVDVIFLVKKSFGSLPLGDAVTTDDNGEAVADFPTDIPGDHEGNVTVLAKVEENDQTGELLATKSTNWGVPTTVKDRFDQRTLWGTAENAPITLVVTVVSLVALVWGIIIYMLSQLVKINRLGKA